MKICNHAKDCKNTNCRCLHLKLHGYNIECDKRLKKSYGWPNGLGCYYYPDTECIELSFKETR